MKRSHGLVLGIILLFAAGFRMAELNRDFDRNPEGCGAFYGLLARNYFRYGITQSYGVPILSMGQDAPPVFYANHPATTPLLIAFVHLLTGYRGGYDSLPADWQTRLPAACFTVACAAMIFLLVKKRSTPRAALVATALFVAIPMTLYYGGLPDVINSQLVFFALLTIAAYERFVDRPNGRRFALLVLAFGGAAVMDWPAFFLVPVLGVHYVLTRPAKQWTWIIGFGCVSVIIFLTLYMHCALGQSSWNWMAAQVERRAMSGETDSADHFTMVQWAKHALWEICIARHTPIVVILALSWVVTAGTRRFSGMADRFAGLLLGWGGLHVLMGRQGVYQHEWWWWPLTPGFAIAAGLMIEQILIWMESRRFPAIAANVCIALALVAFGAWNSWAVVREFESPKKINKGGIEYTLKEFGEVIRKSAPPNRIVMVAESDDSLGFWYYADRAMKRGIWDLSILEARQNDGKVDLSFEAHGPYPQPVGAMIIPKSYIGDLQGLIHDLDARYRMTETPKFLIYDLSAPKASTQSAG